jgi:tetratricopeptide (TPR) repeat protein
MMRGIAVLAVLTSFLQVGLRAEQPRETAPSEIISQSNELLEKHDATKAETLVRAGLAAFPDDQPLKVQLARVFAYQGRDHRAIDLLKRMLRLDPGNREAKLALAQIHGYRKSYRLSDRLYRELLAVDAYDETASLGLVHNLILEGKREEAVERAQQALRKHPDSLGVQQYNDYLEVNTNPEKRPESWHRVQEFESYVADSSGNHSLYSAQFLLFPLGLGFTSRSWMEETSLWKPGVAKERVLSGTEEIQSRVNKFLRLRASGGAVRFADANSLPLYAGDLDLFPFKNLLISGGYSRYPIYPTVDAVPFDLLGHGWHTRIDYRTRNFSITANGALGRYSDGNRVQREFAEFTKWFGLGPLSIGGGYAFRHLHFSEDLNHGYFSPGQYDSHLGAAGVRFHIRNVYRAEYFGYGGGEIVRGMGGYTPAGELLLKNDFLLGKWDLSADYSHFHLLQNSGAFRADAVSLKLGYKF